MPQSDKILKAKNWRCYLVLKHIYIKEMRVLKHTIILLYKFCVFLKELMNVIWCFNVCLKNYSLRSKFTSNEPVIRGRNSSASHSSPRYHGLPMIRKT